MDGFDVKVRSKKKDAREWKNMDNLKNAGVEKQLRVSRVSKQDAIIDSRKTPPTSAKDTSTTSPRT